MEEDMSELKSRIKRIEILLESQAHRNSSGNTSTNTGTAYGVFVRSLCPLPNGSILPRPVTSSVADLILPPYEGQSGEHRILESDFRDWMTKISKKESRYYVSFEGGKQRGGRRSKKVDFHVVIKDKPSVDFYTVAIFGLLSHSGNFNGTKEVGDLFLRLQDLLNPWRCKIVGGLTNGFECEWFVMEMLEGQLRIEVTPVYDFRTSLSSFLRADLTTFSMHHHTEMGFDAVRQLGAGRTSAVYLVNHKNEDCAAKFYKMAYREIRNYELEILKILNGVEGVPTVVDEFLNLKETLFMKPVGVPLTAGISISGAHKAVFSGIVDIFRAAHLKGIVHRDVRMPNILLVGADGNRTGVVVIDWGFAARVEVPTKFSGSVQTGSDRVLEHLKSKLGMETELQSAGEVFDPNMQPVAEASLEGFNSLGKRSRTPSTGKRSRTPSMSSQSSTERLTRAKARMMKESASVVSEFLFQPSDDLVSLVRTLLMYQCKEVQTGLKNINKSDYEGHIKFWVDQMQSRPAWGIAQNYAENSNYDQLKIWIENYATNFL